MALVAASALLLAALPRMAEIFEVLSTIALILFVSALLVILVGSPLALIILPILVYLHRRNARKRAEAVSGPTPNPHRPTSIPGETRQEMDVGE
jgi:hypothetical protein